MARREETHEVPLDAGVLGAFSLIVVSVVLLLLFVASSLLSPYFATPYNMTIIARSLAFTGLVTLGQAMLMLLGELDISLGAMGGLCGVAAGMLMMDVVSQSVRGDGPRYSARARCSG